MSARRSVAASLLLLISTILQLSIAIRPARLTPERIKCDCRKSKCEPTTDQDNCLAIGGQFLRRSQDPFNCICCNVCIITQDDYEPCDQFMIGFKIKCKKTSFCNKKRGSICVPMMEEDDLKSELGRYDVEAEHAIDNKLGELVGHRRSVREAAPYKFRLRFASLFGNQSSDYDYNDEYKKKLNYIKGGSSNSINQNMGSTFIINNNYNFDSKVDWPKQTLYTDKDGGVIVDTKNHRVGQVINSTDEIDKLYINNSTVRTWNSDSTPPTVSGFQTINGNRTPNVIHNHKVNFGPNYQGTQQDLSSFFNQPKPSPNEPQFGMQQQQQQQQMQQQNFGQQQQLQQQMGGQQFGGQQLGGQQQLQQQQQSAFPSFLSPTNIFSQPFSMFAPASQSSQNSNNFFQMTTPTTTTSTESFTESSTDTFLESSSESFSESFSETSSPDSFSLQETSSQTSELNDTSETTSIQSTTSSESSFMKMSPFPSLQPFSQMTPFPQLSMFTKPSSTTSSSQGTTKSGSWFWFFGPRTTTPKPDYTELLKKLTSGIQKLEQKNKENQQKQADAASRNQNSAPGQTPGQMPGQMPGLSQINQNPFFG